jgi:hypothetical protein
MLKKPSLLNIGPGREPAFVEVDELSLLFGYAPIPAKARALILERKAKADERARERARPARKLARAM